MEFHNRPLPRRSRRHRRGLLPRVRLRRDAVPRRDGPTVSFWPGVNEGTRAGVAARPLGGACRVAGGADSGVFFPTLRRRPCRDYFRVVAAFLRRVSGEAAACAGRRRREEIRRHLVFYYYIFIFRPATLCLRVRGPNTTVGRPRVLV